MALKNIVIRLIGAVLVIAALGAGAQNRNAPPWQRIELGSAAQRYPFAIYSNKPWAGDQRTVKSAVLIFHGVQRNGDDYYAAAARLLAASGVPEAEVMLIAPNFFTPADAKKHALDGMPLWRGSRWNRGEDAANWPWPLSSFQPIDDLLAALLDKTRFPLLERIVVAGHSGGGQVVHRYAVLNNIDETARAAGKRLSYVIANPSSYMYFTPDRPTADGKGFAPYDAQRCPDYNHYRYGPENLVRYAAKPDGMALFKRYAARDVTYLLGTADNDPEHESLDKTCGARAGGVHRLERGRNYIRYERQLAASGVKLTRRTYEVVGVDHDQRRMFGSKCGAAILFGMPEARNASGATCQSA